MSSARLTALALIVASLAGCEEGPSAVDLNEGAEFLEEGEVHTEMFPTLFHDSMASRIRILSGGEELCLNVPNGYTHSGAAVKWQACSESFDQVWVAKVYIGDGGLFHQLRHVKSGKCVDASSSTFTLQNCSYSNAWQAWDVTASTIEFAALENPKSGKVLSASMVALDPAETGGHEIFQGSRCMEVPGYSTVITTLEAASCDGGSNQSFVIEPLYDRGLYHLKAQHSGLCMDLDTRYNEVIQATCASSAFQAWGLHYDWASGYYRILNSYRSGQVRFSGSIVELGFGSTANRWLIDE